MLVKAALFLLVFLGATTAIVYFGQRSFIYPAPRGVAAAPPPGYEFIETATSDGLALRAAYHAPKGNERVLLFFHGNGDNLAGADHATRMLVDEGHGALLAEYRGYGGNPGSPTEQGLYRDADAAISWLARQGITGDRLVIVGNSIGSGPATEMALRHRPKALILVSGFASLPTVVSSIGPFFWLQWLVRDQFDNEAKLARVQSAILVIHGADDRLVRPSNATRLAAAAPFAKLIMVTGAGHELAYRPDAQQIIGDWLATLP